MTDITVKVCNTCQEPKGLEFFGKDGRNADGLQGRCYTCKNSRRRKETVALTEAEVHRREQMERRANGLSKCGTCGEVKDLSEFYQTVKGCSSDCKSCRSAKSAKQNQDPEHKAKRKAQGYAYKISTYGLTVEQYDALVDKQGNKCGNLACEATEPGGRGRWHIDHDHDCCPGTKSCGECIRGLLCTRCNHALGLADDDIGKLRGLIEYLEAAQ